jgi:hypothetical protein
VVLTLSAVAKQPPDMLIDRDRIVTLLKRWRKVDQDLTETLNEAKVRRDRRLAMDDWR